MFMRLWHQDLIAYLPYQQLLGQHREICAMRGKGWKRKHQTVDYVYTHPLTISFTVYLLSFVTFTNTSTDSFTSLSALSTDIPS